MSTFVRHWRETNFVKALKPASPIFVLRDEDLAELRGGRP